jgi:outer membrane biosynthesis protein TonB
MKKYYSVSKNLMGLALFLGSTSLVVAQNEIAIVDHDITHTLTTEVTEASIKYVSNADTEDAVEQIRHHIGSNLAYPALLFENQLTGVVTIEVNIEADGTLGKTYMVKGLTKVIDQDILRVTKSLKKIELLGQSYRGINTVHIPIRFTNTF